MSSRSISQLIGLSISTSCTLAGLFAAEAPSPRQFFFDLSYSNIADSAVGRDGAIYLTGEIFEQDREEREGRVELPSPSNLPFFSDSYIVKIGPDREQVELVEYFGGSRNDIAKAIAVDDFGYIYVSGVTDSEDFPLGSESSDGLPHEASGDAGLDVFVVKLAPDGGQVLRSWFLGGSRRDEPTDLVVSPSGEVFVSGFTESIDFPATGIRAVPSQASGIAATEDGGLSWGLRHGDLPSRSVLRIEVDPRRDGRL